MKNTYIIFIAFCALLISGCAKDVFDKKPLDKISEADVWKDKNLIRAYVTNLYSRFPFNGAFSDNYRYSDESSYADGPKTNITEGRVSKTSEGLSYWDYTIIRDCNIFISKIDKVSSSVLSNQEKNGFLAEVKVIRAVVYYEMAKRYGGVPLITTVLDPFAAPEENMLPRNKEIEIYDFIVKELDEAIPMLSKSSTPRGVINRWTAFAYKSRACNWAACIAKYGTLDPNGLTGVPSERANAFFQLAYNSADSVILSGQYQLYNKIPDKSKNYQNIFNEKNHSEIIFHRVYNGIDIGHNWDKGNIPPSFTGPGAGKCNPVWEFLLSYENIDGSTDQPNIGTAYLYNSFAEALVKKDPRLHATVMYQGTLWQRDTVMVYEGIDTGMVASASSAKILAGKTAFYTWKRQTGKDSKLSSASNDNVTKTGFYIKKYMDESNVLPLSGQAKTNWIEIRLAEMYLTKAEAAMELGLTDAAVAAVNVTRQRAGITLLNSGNITMDKIRNERKIELAFENHRYWDLRRWRTAEAVLTNGGKKFQGIRPFFHWKSQKYYFIKIDGEDFTRSFRREHYYNPITTARINNNRALIENPNY